MENVEQDSLKVKLPCPQGGGSPRKFRLGSAPGPACEGRGLKGMLPPGSARDTQKAAIFLTFHIPCDRK